MEFHAADRAACLQGADSLVRQAQLETIGTGGDHGQRIASTEQAACGTDARPDKRHSLLPGPQLPSSAKSASTVR